MKTSTAYKIVTATVLGAGIYFFSHQNPDFSSEDIPSEGQVYVHESPYQKNKAKSSPQAEIRAKHNARIKDLHNQITEAKLNARDNALIQSLEEQLEDEKEFGKPFALGQRAKQRIKEYENDWIEEAENRQLQELENYLQEHRKKSFPPRKK